jgi:hypothetical protein
MGRMVVPILLFSACVSILSISTGFLFDEASFMGQYYMYYMFGAHIFYFWPFGLYYYIMTMSAFLINIPFAFFGLDSAIVQEFTVKLPFIISMYLTAMGIYLILLYEKVDKGIAKKVLWITLLTPIILYDAAFHGNGLIVAVFFEIFSVVFLYKKRYNASSVFLGFASASYLFPIFLIIPMVYFIKRTMNLRKSIQYFGLFSLVFLIGQGVPLLIYLFYGIPFNYGSVLGGIAGVTSTGLPASNAISPWGPYFLIHEFSGYLITMRMAEIIFAIAMFVPGLVFAKFKKDPSIKDLIGVFLIESLFLVIFGINSAPQYLVAIAPFSILLFVLDRDHNHLNFLTLLTFFDLGSFVTSATTIMAGFFIIINPYLNAYYLKSPPVLSQTLYSLYVIFLFLYLAYFVHSRLSPGQKSVAKKERVQISEEETKRVASKLFSYFVIFMILIVVLVAPGLRDPPPVIPTVNNLMQEAYEAKQYISDNNTLNSFNSSYRVNMSIPWIFLNSYAKNDGKYVLNLPSWSPFSFILGDFAQTSYIRAYPNATYSERFYFPHPSFFKGYFVIFGKNVTPLVYMEGNKPNEYINLTNSTQEAKVVYVSNAFFEVKDQELIKSGWHTLKIIIPEKEAYFSTTEFNGSGASFRTYTSDSKVHVNATYIPDLMVNSTEVENTTLSLYLNLSSAITVSFNGMRLGNYSTSNTISIPVQARIVKDTNNITVDGYYINTQHIVLYFNPPLSFSSVALSEDIANLSIGILFLSVSILSLYELILFIRKNM